MPSELALQLYESLWKKISDDNVGWSRDIMLLLIDANIAPLLAENEWLKANESKCRRHAIDCGAEFMQACITEACATERAERAESDNAALHQQVKELEEMVSDAESRANERGRRIHELEQQLSAEREKARVLQCVSDSIPSAAHDTEALLNRIRAAKDHRIALCYWSRDDIVRAIELALVQTEQLAAALHESAGRGSEILDLQQQVAALRVDAERLVNDWRRLAQESRDEAARIGRTMKVFTSAEDRCVVRAKVWERCAAAIDAARSPAGTGPA